MRRITQPGFPFFLANNPLSAFRALHGKRDFEQDGSYVTTEWVSLLWLPLLPFRTLRVIDAVDRRSSFLDRTLGRFIDIFLWEGDLVEEVPLSFTQAASTYVFVGGLVVIAKQAQQSAKPRMLLLLGNLRNDLRHRGGRRRAGLVWP